jgi:hypothetical protein
MKKRCPAEAFIELAPRLSYFSQPIELSQSVRIHYPVTFADYTALVISPPDCVEGVYYRLNPFEVSERYESKLTRPFKTLRTRFWKTLLTDRKWETHDELYDVSSDPTMVRNLIHIPTYRKKALDLDAAIDSLYTELSARRPLLDTLGTEYSDEEIEMLRSLGYIR